jgi:hypothetical protein
VIDPTYNLRTPKGDLHTLTMTYCEYFFADKHRLRWVKLWAAEASKYPLMTPLSAFCGHERVVLEFDPPAVQWHVYTLRAEAVFPNGNMSVHFDHYGDAFLAFEQVTRDIDRIYQRADESRELLEPQLTLAYNLAKLSGETWAQNHSLKEFGDHPTAQQIRAYISKTHTEGSVTPQVKAPNVYDTQIQGVFRQRVYWKVNVEGNVHIVMQDLQYTEIIKVWWSIEEGFSFEIVNQNALIKWHISLLFTVLAVIDPEADNDYEVRKLKASFGL